MALPIFQRTVVTDTGDIVPGAEVTVILEATGLEADIYSDRDGTVALSNPFFTGDDGVARFYAAQGAYEVTAVGVSGTVTWPYNELIDSGEVIANTANIATNTAAIADNAANIATNTSNIAANTEAIDALGDFGNSALLDTATAAEITAGTEHKVVTADELTGSEYSFAVDQQLVDVSASRTIGVSVTNSSGKARWCSVTLSHSSGSSSTIATITNSSGTVIVKSSETTNLSGIEATVTFLAHNGAQYTITSDTSSGTIVNWVESEDI